MDYTRHPCPHRITEDCGGAFVMGTLGGGFFQFLKGFRNSPSGLRRSLIAGVNMMKMRTPATAMNFAVWGALFATIECTLISYRKREDIWNPIICGAGSGGLMAARRGVPAMINGAVMGGTIMGLLEVAGVFMAIKEARNNYEDPTATMNVDYQWKQANLNPEESFSSPEEFEEVLEKCREYRDAKEGERCMELLDLITIAEII